MSEEEEEVVDQLESERNKCKESVCNRFVEALQTCNDRVTSRKQTDENCHDEVVDLMLCVDKCALHKAFAMLK